MPQSTLVPKSKNLALYTELRRQVREALSRGRARAQDAVEREKVRTSWQVGKLILEHILLHKDRAQYGEQVLKRLSGDLGISERELRYMVEVARTYPISPPAAKLSWGHYRDLLSINEEKQRKELIDQASRKKWSRSTLRHEIGKLKAAKKITVSSVAPAEEPLIPLKGKLDTYRVVDYMGKKTYDLGFSTYFEIKGKAPKAEPKPEDLYTYEAQIETVIDGDTLWAQIHLGFGVWTRQKLRLRGLDAPEIETRDGQETKKFLERQLKTSKEVIITSTKSDKYDRYLADLWTGETLLNQKLIDQGLAVRIFS